MFFFWDDFGHVFFFLLDFSVEFFFWGMNLFWKKG